MSKLSMSKLSMRGIAIIWFVAYGVNATSQETGNEADARSNVIRSQAVVSGGKFVGVRVYPGRDRDRFLCYGLQPGDLVTAVDGVALDNQASAQQILESIQKKKQRSILSANREGKPLRVQAHCDSSTN